MVALLTHVTGSLSFMTMNSTTWDLFCRGLLPFLLLCQRHQEPAPNAKRGGTKTPLWTLHISPGSLQHRKSRHELVLSTAQARTMLPLLTRQPMTGQSPGSLPSSFLSAGENPPPDLDSYVLLTSGIELAHGIAAEATGVYPTWPKRNPIQEASH